MYLAVKEVKPIDNYKLILTFENNEVKIFDMIPYLDKVIPESGSVLEIGCGFGKTLNWVYEKNNTLEIVGSDLSEIAIIKSQNFYPHIKFICEDAETTKTNVESFVKNFNDAVQKAVAEALRGKTPRLKDGSKELTKEDILKIKNRTERQKAMAEHPELFR